MPPTKQPALTFMFRVLLSPQVTFYSHIIFKVKSCLRASLEFTISIYANYTLARNLSKGVKLNAFKYSIAMILKDTTATSTLITESTYGKIPLLS